MRLLFTILMLAVILPLRAQDRSAALQMQKLVQVWRYLSALYVDEVDMAPLTESAIRGMIEELDPHSAYIGAEEMKSVEASFDGEFSGIGVEFSVLRDTIHVVNTIAGGPAERVGMLPNDRIVRIDTTDAVGFRTADVPKYLRGRTGTRVEVDVVRPGEAERLHFVMIRDRIPLNTVDAAYTTADGIGYIKVNRFGRTTMSEFREAFAQLGRPNRLILDLRGNGGGVIAAGLAMLDEILSEPVEMVTCRWRSDNGGDQAATSKGGGLPLNGLYVLVDKNTASAAEMMAACIKDAGAGELIGEKTYGKSLGQFHLSLTNGDTLVITTLEMRTPKTGVWEGKGVVPDKQTASIVTVDDYLKGKEPLSAVRPLIFGETGSQVTALTERLHLLGLLDETGDTLTAEVMKAVHIFQAASDLPESIQVDIATQKKLNEMMNQVSDYYVDNALEEAMLLAQEAAEQPLKYTPHADGSWAA